MLKILDSAQMTTALWDAVTLRMGWVGESYFVHTVKTASREEIFDTKRGPQAQLSLSLPHLYEQCDMAGGRQYAPHAEWRYEHG
jgi:hypothetical protein